MTEAVKCKCGAKRDDRGICPALCEPPQPPAAEVHRLDHHRADARRTPSQRGIVMIDPVVGFRAGRKS